MTNERTTVATFLRKCNEYARASIERKIAREEPDEIARWEAYIEFNEHALEEIANGTLDRWFTDAPEHIPPIHRMDASTMEHVERSTWLNNVLSPRPVVVAATLDDKNRRNLAPMTSVMAVSTAPPYLTASFSVHKDGELRDTLRNLRSTGKAILNVLPATPLSAAIVDSTATPLPHGEDEGALMDLKTVEGETLLLEESVAAIEVHYVEEHPLPDAVAIVAILKVEAIWFGSNTPPLGGIDVLCQHGRDDMMPSPQGWKQRVEKHYGNQRK
ncbi:MAG: flavin reductase family protein [Candidatus Poseidonia sp.]|nr:flavin reductase family protein [Poseidonia sp.]